jgi:hypothetical protein
MRLFRILSAGLFCAGLIGAQSAKPVIGCGDLRSLTNYQVSIATALLVPATADAPEHCRVTGQVLPQVGFEVSLPTQWNGRFYMFGNGGYAGEALDSAARRATAARAMRLGYAAAETDTGHSAATEPLGAFAADRQKLLDYAFRSLHVTADAAKLLVRTYYGGAPTQSYFEGCSTGGRQGLMLAQRFPADFDGIVVGAPVLNFSGTMVAYANDVQALRAAPIPAAKLPLLAGKIYAQCDEGWAQGRPDRRPAPLRLRGHARSSEMRWRRPARLLHGRADRRAREDLRRRGEPGSAHFPGLAGGRRNRRGQRPQRLGPMVRQRRRPHHRRGLQRGFLPLSGFCQARPEVRSEPVQPGPRSAAPRQPSTRLSTPPIRTSLVSSSGAARS